MRVYHANMTLDIYKSVISACPLLLRPVIKILLRAGITYKQFASIAKDIFVQVAIDDYGISGRKTNTSRVAILTGISRSEVTKVRKKLEESGEIEVPTTVSNAGRLLSGWHIDEDFTDSNGDPLPLSIEGAPPNFSSLMNRYGGDIPLTAMLKELKTVSAVDELDDGRLYPLKRFFMPVNYDENRIFQLADTFAAFGNTLYFNFVRDAQDISRFEGHVTNDYIDESILPQFREIVEEKGASLLYELDDWLANHEIDLGKDSKKIPIKLGLGMYLIHEENN